MPRTKVSKNSKRNRNAAIREEKIREFDSVLEQCIDAFDLKVKQDISELDTELSLIKTRIPQKVLSMKISDLLSMNVTTFSQLQAPPASSQLQVDTCQTPQTNRASRLLRVRKLGDDEGYLTEESNKSGVGNVLANLSHIPTRINKGLMGPLNSAKARKTRRSRSACGSSYNIKHVESSGHISRMKARTPLLTRQKAFSADRTLNVRNDLPESSAALLRWPKPGEMILSITGTPIVSRVMPEQYANINIPIRDGVLSLRPKKLENLDPELVNKIDGETLSQIKTLQSNLELIMSYAKKMEI